MESRNNGGQNVSYENESFFLENNILILILSNNNIFLNIP